MNAATRVSRRLVLGVSMPAIFRPLRRLIVSSFDQSGRVEWGPQIARHGRSSGHDSDRPLAGSHQPDRHRANKPVASFGGRPDDDSLRADLAGHTAQLGEWVAAPGHEGGGDAPLPGLPFDLAAQVVGGLVEGLVVGDSHRATSTGHRGGQRGHRPDVNDDQAGALAAGQPGGVRAGSQRCGGTVDADEDHRWAVGPQFEGPRLAERHTGSMDHPRPARVRRQRPMIRSRISTCKARCCGLPRRRARYPGQIADTIAVPEPLDNGHFELEGHRLDVIETGHTDTVDTTSLHVPDLDLIVSGDVAYNHCHMYVGATTPGSRAEWIAALDQLAALNPAAVVTGHKDPTQGNPPSVLAESRGYLEYYGQLREAGLPEQELFDAMVSRYPDWVSRQQFLLLGITGNADDPPGHPVSQSAHNRT